MVATAENYSADILCDALRRAGVSPDVMMRVNDPRWPPARTLDTIVPYTIMGGASDARYRVHSPAAPLGPRHRLPLSRPLKRLSVEVFTCHVGNEQSGSTCHADSEPA